VVVARSDVIVVGAGPAGLSAALEAASRGASVAILDAAGDAGGTAKTAGAGTCIAGSPLQSREGIQDSPQRALDDWLAWGGPTADEKWAGRYLEASVPDVYERLASLGVEWFGVRQPEGNSVPRWHRARGGGLAVMHAVEGAVRALSSHVSWHLGVRARELTVAGGEVVGVLGEGADGRREYRARSVLVATGGFANSLEMVRTHASAAAGASRVLLGGGRGALGEGHSMLAGVGARFVNLDSVWMYPYAVPDHRDADGKRGLAVRGLDGDLWVGTDGRRFHNEVLRGGASGTAALLRQPGGTCWSVIDARIASRFNVADPFYRTGLEPMRDRLQELLVDSPFVVTARSIRELAEAAGIDAPNLEQEVRESNAAIRAGRTTDALGKPLAGLEPLIEPPFYAIRFLPLARKNLGGVRTNLECQVLDVRGQPIPGLFAAGEVAGMAGGRVNGRAALEGTMFGPSFYSGMVAGRNMVA
jgi:predicted oxidoreductase